MSFGKCLKSMFIFYSSEFIFIWLYLGFAIYFWIQVAFIALHEDPYNFKQDDFYIYMLIVTIAIAVSVTFTLVYLIFYPISERTK